MTIDRRAPSRVGPRLQVIDKGRCVEPHPVPLLFVHGAFHGAWCWDEHFLDFFAEKGYRALAVSLRGHGGSSTTKPLNNCSVAEYVDDVCSAADRLRRRPVVIGHSMGGFVVQKYLEKRQAPAGVLMGSVPPRGAVGVHLRLLRRHPWLVTTALITGKWLHCVNSAKLAREAFFSAHSPEAEVVRFAARFREESARAIRGMMSDLPRPEHVTVPLLVLGAGDDGIVSAEEVRATARAYRTEAEIFPDMGHDMMLEAGWRAVADRIHNWLVARGL